MVCVVPKPVQSAFVFALTLTSAATSGTYPFTFGVAFKKADVPSSFVTDLSNYQVKILRTWNDGSVKHAIVSGRAAFTQNVAKTVNISRGTPPSGTALTASSIQTAAPSASIQCGGLGTVNLSSLLASPVRTFVSGAEMVECHYRSDLGSGISAWFHVRLFADGSMWVRCIAENGYLDNGSGALSGNSTQSYVPTLSINGSTVYSNGGSSLSHYTNTRYMAEGWIGTDPQITPIVDVSYLRSSKLVPNYSVAPASSVFTGLTQTYTPMSNGNLTVTMGDTGYQAAIGPLPNWNAAFIASGDARAFKSTLANSSHLNSYGIVWRAKTDNSIAKPSGFTTWTTLGPGGGGVGTPGIGRGALYWENAHHPGEAYLAYLLTGDYWHYETLAFNAMTFYWSINSSNGSGTSREFDDGQVRGLAWGMRTFAQLASITPDADMGASTLGADARALFSYQCDFAITRINAATSNVYTGWVWVPEIGQWNSTGSVPSWQGDFLACSYGFSWDLEPLTSTANFQTARDQHYKWPIGRLGQSGVSAEYGFTRAAQYGIDVATANNNSSWYSTFGAIYTAEIGSANTVVETALQDGNFPNMDSYWANLQPAIAYAVDHGASGASSAYGRMSGASNWSTLFGNFQDFPVWAVSPRA